MYRPVPCCCLTFLLPDIRIKVNELRPFGQKRYSSIDKIPEKPNITQQLKELIDIYGINTDTLSKYFELSVGQIERLSKGCVSFRRKIRLTGSGCLTKSVPFITALLKIRIYRYVHF